MKDLGGTLTLAAANTYTGGSYFSNSGDITVSLSGGLGAGQVSISNSRVVTSQINASSFAGTTGVSGSASNATYNVINNGQLTLNFNTAGAATQTVHVGAGSILCWAAPQPPGV